MINIQHYSLIVGFSEDELIGRRKYDDIATARNLYMKYLRDFGYSLPRIGKMIGNRHHATVLSNVKRANNLLETGDQRATEIWNKVKTHLSPLTIDRGWKVK